MNSDGKGRGVRWLALALTGIAGGMFHGSWKGGKPAATTPEEVSAAVTVPRMAAADGVRRSTAEMVDFLYSGHNLIDSELALGQWVQTAPAEEIGSLLGALAGGPAGSDWREQAMMVASLWAEADPKAAIAFVSTHRTDHWVALEAGNTWAFHDPEAASQWLRGQTDLSHGECAGVVCGLSVSAPELTREFMARAEVMYPCDLWQIENAIVGRGPAYFGAWLDAVKNEENFKELLINPALPENFNQDTLVLLSKLSDPRKRETVVERLCPFSLEGEGTDVARAFLEKIPAADRAYALARLHSDDPKLAALMDAVPPEVKERAILRYLNEDCQTRDHRDQVFPKLVPDPEERKNYIPKFKVLGKEIERG